MGENSDMLRRFALNTLNDASFDVTALNVNKYTGEVVIALKRSEDTKSKDYPYGEGRTPLTKMDK